MDFGFWDFVIVGCGVGSVPRLWWSLAGWFSVGWYNITSRLWIWCGRVCRLRFCCVISWDGLLLVGFWLLWI